MPGHASLGFPEVAIDLNARLDRNTYMADLPCTLASLQSLELTLETAIGKTFAFVDISGTVNDSGAPDDSIFYGVIARSDDGGYVALADTSGLLYRSGHVDV
jgi:hypothetical protein